MFFFLKALGFSLKGVGVMVLNFLHLIFFSEQSRFWRVLGLILRALYD